MAKHTPLGSQISPAHFPAFTGDDLQAYFAQAAQIGGHVTQGALWSELPAALSGMPTLKSLATAQGLTFNVALSVTSLDQNRTQPLVPAGCVASFTSLHTRAKFLSDVLAIAALRPQVLTLATEINLLAANPPEYAAFVTLVQSARAVLKFLYPTLTLSVSFQWDVMLMTAQLQPLVDFLPLVDLLGFTTFPYNVFASADLLPPDFYSILRQVLPTQRIALSEVGWCAADVSQEAAQASFYARLPSLVAGMQLEFVTLALLHDMSLYSGPLDTVGVRYASDTPKPSWETVKGLAL